MKVSSLKHYRDLCTYYLYTARKLGTECLVSNSFLSPKVFGKDFKQDMNSEMKLRERVLIFINNTGVMDSVHVEPESDS